MQMVFSTWDNNAVGNPIDIENGSCPNSTHSCDYAYSVFSNVMIKTEGSNEDPDYTPEPPGPEPQPAEW